jgi:hypothetical protein
VKYLLLPPQYGFGAETLNAKKGLDLEEVYSGPDGRILRNRRVRPRVRLQGTAGEVRVLARAPGLWRIAVRAEGDGTLVVADPFFPGWRARVDRAESTFAALPGEPMRIRLPAGPHEVELDYRPSSFRAGVTVAGVAALMVALLFRRKSSVRSS